MHKVALCLQALNPPGTPAPALVEARPSLNHNLLAPPTNMILFFHVENGRVNWAVPIILFLLTSVLPSLLEMTFWGSLQPEVRALLGSKNLAPAVATPDLPRLPAPPPKLLSSVPEVLLFVLLSIATRSPKPCLPSPNLDSAQSFSPSPRSSPCGFVNARHAVGCPLGASHRCTVPMGRHLLLRLRHHSLPASATGMKTTGSGPRPPVSWE